MRRPVYVGIDLFKNVWSKIIQYPELRSLYVLEPTVILPLRRSYHYLYVTPGFARFEERAASFVSGSQLSGRGYYLRVGVEKRRHRLSFGGGGILTRWQDQGSYWFKGSYFGDYVGVIAPKNHLAIGGELVSSMLLPLGKRFATRFQYRLTALTPYGNQDERPAPVYLPGIGLHVGNRWTLSHGFSAQLLYRTPSTKRP